MPRAPFTARPETLDPGDLLGPFDGLVLDAETERPLPEAVVSASWAFEGGVGLVGPAGGYTLETVTNPDGRYELPSLPRLPEGASARVARFTLVIYKRGYVVWRSDHLFPSGEARKDFSQNRNQVRLMRWRDELSHARHVVFMGGSPAVREAAAWERQPAALELRTPVPGAPEIEPTPTGLLDASPLLTEAELRAISTFEGLLTVGRLPDLPRSEFYDSLHFRAETESERDDVAVRLWRLGEVAAEAQYRQLVSELPEAEARGELGDASVRVRAEEVRAVVFLVRDPGFVVSVTCGLGQCDDAAKVSQLARLVRERLGRLPSPGDASGGDQGVGNPFEAPRSQTSPIPGASKPPEAEPKPPSSGALTPPETPSTPERAP
ncbi:MAG: carboxypeptidase-like regulatory domain-containing protein [Myxococcales bacterium]|nr:carboxypeptidase-like regulatory domain-containing protein [Myxococcales bacterium]